MLSIGIGEIQKNSSVFSNLTEAMQIIDKRKKQVLAMVYPLQSQSVIDTLAGKYKDKIQPTTLTFEQIKESAIKSAMEDKYGLSS
ncbi:hypothetical protein [Sulfurimonas sp.]|uniref:hypothetical protein n=1 Tax=Sulfurimonas sp. TaxID=2022749 RepID=UPI002AB232AE|nr:hypothetical protein [Sulfurimonas sp.]